MNLKELIEVDFIASYKNKEFDKKNFLGTLRGTIQTHEGNIGKLTDDNIALIIKSYAKNINENIETKTKLGLPIDEHLLEMEWLKPYLPQMLSKEQIIELVDAIIAENDSKNPPVLLGMFNKKYKPLGLNFDNKLVLEVITSKL